MIWPHIVMLHPSVETVDERGNPIRVPAATGVESRAYVQPRGSTEDGTAVAVQAVVYLPADADRLDAFSHLVWLGVTFEMVGAVVELHTPTGRHHWRAELRKVGA